MTVNTRNEIMQKVIESMDLVYQHLLEFKCQKNSVLLVIKNGKIVKIKP